MLLLQSTSHIELCHTFTPLDNVCVCVCISLVQEVFRFQFEVFSLTQPQNNGDNRQPN